MVFLSRRTERQKDRISNPDARSYPCSSLTFVRIQGYPGSDVNGFRALVAIAYLKILSDSGSDIQMNRSDERSSEGIGA